MSKGNYPPLKAESFEERAAAVRDHIKKVVDNNVEIAQKHRQTKTVAVEMSFKQGGLCNLIVKNEESVMP